MWLRRVSREAKIGNLQQLGIVCEVKAAHLVLSVSPEARKGKMLLFLALFIALVYSQLPLFSACSPEIN